MVNAFDMVLDKLVLNNEVNWEQFKLSFIR